MAIIHGRQQQTAAAITDAKATQKMTKNRSRTKNAIQSLQAPT